MKKETKTEFWITIAIIAAATILCALGKISGEAFGIATGISGGTYSWSRGKKKAAEAIANGGNGS